MFTLHPALENGSALLHETDLYQVRLKNDQRFVWLQLIPKHPNVSELFELPSTDAAEIFLEIQRLSALLKTLTQADRINVAWLGNVVPQLHVHIVARHHHDLCWPAPIWGNGESVPYADFNMIVQNLKQKICNSPAYDRFLTHFCASAAH